MKYSTTSSTKKPMLMKEVYPYILDFDRFYIGTNMESHNVLASERGLDDHRELPNGVVTVDHVIETTWTTYYTWSGSKPDSILQEKAHDAIRERYGYTSYKKGEHRNG